MTALAMAASNVDSVSSATPISANIMMIWLTRIAPNRSVKCTGQ